MDETDTDSRVKEMRNRFTTLLTEHSLLTPNNNEVLLLNKLQGLVTNIKWSPMDVVDLFDALLKRFDSTTDDRSHLCSWMMKMLHCIEINYISPSWKCHSGKTVIELVRDRTLTDDNLTKVLSDDKEKTLDEILEEIRQQTLNQIDEKLLADVRDIVSSVHKDLNLNNDGSQRSGLKKDLLMLCRAAEKTHFRPRLTQMVSWCLMALSKSGWLIQVGTGEGKSCIVAMFAAFRAMRGGTVDIITSSSVLAERDLNDWLKFYKTLGISVSCNTNKQSKDLKKCYECQVVYGTAQQFAGHWLSQQFERMDIFGKRTFGCAIVDEVDSLMLDKGNHVVYISSDMPALQQLNPLLAFIWDTVNQYSKIGTDTDQDSVLRAAEAEVKHALRFTPCEPCDDKNVCCVPGFLSDLINSKLKVWIKNALKAQTMPKDHEYVIEKHGIVPVDYSSTGVVENFMTLSDGLQQFLEMKHKLKLSDMTAITNYKSNVGLFLNYGTQIYGISGTLGQQAEIETLQKIYSSIKTCQIPSFKRRKLFEIEGLIIADENGWIKKICSVVAAEIKPSPYRAGRAVLVICETINRAKALHSALCALGDQVTNKMLYINNNMDNSEIFKELQTGDVIVATNLAGRGTDLQVSDGVKKAGGLSVLQTFLPENARVEAQAFGRTARQGSPGSAQLIVCFSHLSELLQILVGTSKLLSLLKNTTQVTPLHQAQYQKCHRDEESKDMSLTLSRILTENSNSGINIAKKVRDDLVAKGLASYLECDIPKLKKKQKLFNQYLKIRDSLYKSSNNKPAESDLSALNEYWGMWLLTNFNENDSITDLKSRLKTDLHRAMQKLKQKESPSSNLHHYTVFGNELHKNGNLAESIKMYTKAIQEDHCWAAIAYYNRAFASLTQQNRHQDRNCIDQALEDLQNALKSVELYCEQIDVAYRYSTKQTEDTHNDSTTRFDKHIIARYQVLLFFKGNITEAIKKADRARDLGGNVKVEEILVHFMVPLLHFLPLAGLLTESVNLIRNRDPLKMYQLISQPSFDIFNELNRLESLGLTHVYTLDTLSSGGFFSKIQRALLRALN